MALVRIEDRGQVTEADGTLIGESGTNFGKPRWMTIKLYRLASSGEWDDETGWTGPSPGVLLHRAGMSKVYHREGNTTCRRTGSNTLSGLPATIDDLPDDAEPCKICQPPWPLDLPDDARIRFEFPQHNINRCKTAAEAETKLEPRDPTRPMSEPSLSVLDQARINDPEFAILPPRRVQY